MIDYPSSGFLRTALHLLRDGNELIICVRPGWRSTLLDKELVSLPASAAEAGASGSNDKRPSIKMSLLMMPLSIVHHFALSGDFLMSFKKDAGIVISYSRRLPCAKEIAPH